MSYEEPTPPSVLEEVASYIGFDSADAALLENAAAHVRPAFPAIIDAFYRRIYAHPGASRVLRGPAQVERLKVRLRQWLEGLFSGVYDDAYLARRTRIGEAHVQIGLEQRYMFAAMNVVRRGIKDALWESTLTPDVVRETEVALDRICDLELAIMLESYRDAYTSGLLSERIALEHDLEQSETEKAELLRTAAQHEAMATIGTLTAGLAHEVRNPLNAAKLQLELIGRSAAKLGDVDRSTRIQERVGLVNAELSSLAEMLDDFLALARQRHIDRAAFEILPLLSEVLELEGPVAAAADVRLDIRECAGIFVLADRSKIKQVLINLVANSVDAMRISGGCVQLTAQPEDPPGDPPEKVSIEVADTGPGIAPEVAATLFDPFVTTKEAGTGLGLSIVQRIVRSHGGVVEVVSSASNGTTIRFTLTRA